MRITFDREANAAYVYFKEIAEGEVVKTISLNDSISVDLDKEGKTLGIEILNATENLPKTALSSFKVTK